MIDSQQCTSRLIRLNRLNSTILNDFLGYESSGNVGRFTKFSYLQMKKKNTNSLD